MNETGNIPIIAPRVDSLTSEEEAGKVAFTNWGPKQTTDGTELPSLLFDGSFVYCLLLDSPCLYLIINLIMIVCFIPITLLACRTHYYTIKLLILLTTAGHDRAVYCEHFPICCVVSCGCSCAGNRRILSTSDRTFHLALCSMKFLAIYSSLTILTASCRHPIQLSFWL